MKTLFLLIAMIFSLSLFAEGRKANSVTYYHAEAGVGVTDAITATSVDKDTWGWMICEDAEATATFLAISSGADPALDGIRIGPGKCFYCENCGSKSLIDANVKAQAASTGYSVIQFK
jgi:hypothetical protein